MIIRTIIYDGSAEALNAQLSRSLPDGIRDFGQITIGIVTLPTPSTFGRYLRDMWRLYREVRQYR